MAKPCSLSTLSSNFLQNVKVCTKNPNASPKSLKQGRITCALNNKVKIERRTAIALALGIFSQAAPAMAALNRKGSNDAYEEMMRSMKEANRDTSADKAYNQAGGACGPGYELKVVKVTGATCECVDPVLCKRAAPPSLEERSFGKPSSNVDASDGPITITFN
eukprot:CAMPEP_0196579276 /NCGR_PEP_ID=MMETSP1081-20130531/19829_1 /TAXON_ID=36882 /ORGANISM="Pyramimonas amylifera, Strain CCMP720" /LENGTH=162 /DNA_ID=CAMNT_0041898805 /DNA_START=58 /DNA_END=546 /DNA_ORIENTATION=+